MRTLAVVALVLGLAVAVRADQRDQSTKELIRKIQAELPKGWSAKYNAKNAWLEVKRDKKVLSYDGHANRSPMEKPEKRVFAFAFRVVARISQDEYSRLSAENARTEKAAQAIHDDLLRRRVTHKFDSFVPDTSEDAALVARYEQLRDSEVSPPPFYFQDIALQLVRGSSFEPVEIDIIDDGIRDECERVRLHITGLLSRYAGGPSLRQMGISNDDRAPR